ncbi:hypothetical protein JCM21900_000843 [Sporobolomyces salmonicolor]
MSGSGSAGPSGSTSRKLSYHRKRSPSSSSGATASAANSRSATDDDSTPAESRYERSGAATKLLQAQLKHAAATATASTPAPRAAAAASTPTTDSRIQFEQQEDFISFDLSPSPPPRDARGTPRDAGPGGRGGRKGKRKLADVDDRQEEGTRTLQRREKERSTPWCEEPGVDWNACDTAIGMLNAETKAFVSYISPTPIEHELRMHTIEIIRRTIKSKYANADVQCFGSVGTGLYLPGGDIDLVVLCPSMPAPPLKPSSSLLHRLASLLLTSSIAQPSSLVVIAKARVPIVKFTTRYGGFAVDLSVNQKNGVDAAVRVRGLLEDFAFREEGWVEPGSRESSTGLSIKGSSEKGKGKGKEKAAEAPAQEDGAVASVDHGVARSLVLLVKAFLSQRGMNEVFTGGLGSYSIICLVVSFLQLHPKIQSAAIQPARNVGLLFLEFLEYYGKHFNFDEAGITLRGRGGYFNKHDKGWYRPAQPYLLSIEDPNDPQNDVSGGSHNILRVRQTFAGGFDTLSATILHRVSLLASRRIPSVLPLSSSALPNADSDPPSALTQSILGSIVGISSKDVKSREDNVLLWEDGALQSLIERTDANGGTLGKKALKKAQKDEKERQRREKTIAKLERKQEEQQAKEERRAARKEKKKAKVVEPVVDPKAIEEAKAAAASLDGLAGPETDEDSDLVVSRVGSAVDAHDEKSDDDADESRYSLGVPALARKKANPTPSTSNASGRPIYTHASSDSSDDEEDDDGDVVLGGGGGDFVRFDSTQQDAEDDDDDESTSGSDDNSSAAEVLQTLVPPAKRARTGENGQTGKKDGTGAAAARKAKAAARMAFWGAKGKKDAGSDSD